MKKILFTLLISLFMISNVNASTEISNPLEHGMTILPQSCSDNMLKVGFSKFTYSNGRWRTLDETDLASTSSLYFANDYLIEIEPDTRYYYYSTLSAPFYIHIFDENLTQLSSTTYYPSSSFTSPTNAKYLLLGRYITPSGILKVSQHSFMISKGSSYLDYVDYEQCPVEVADTTLDNFYSIYVTKLKELSEFTIENKFVLSAFVIVLIFALLASFIHLFGRRKR